MKKKISIVLVLAFIIGLIPSVAKAKLVACVGNSNTYGAGIPDRTSNCYPAQLQMLLRQCDPTWETQNFGVNGATVLRQGATPYVKQAAYNQALASEPDVVIMCFGANGSRSFNRGYIEEFYVSDYISLIDAFADLPSRPQIWLCYPLKAFSGSYSISDAILRDQIIPLVDQVASLRSLPIIDFYTAFEDSPDLYQSDGIHPNPGGAKLMAEVVAASIIRGPLNPDVNGDEMVDFKDFCILAQYWSAGKSSADIAGGLCGEQSRHYEDLAGFVECWLRDTRLLAHWKLDETEGAIAHDSIGGKDGYGAPDLLWRPDGGMVGGALGLEGIDDFLFTTFSLNPAARSFGVFAWVKGGAAEQVIVSQGQGANWLCADPSGNLMTSLSAPGGGRILPQPLVSEFIITDGEWHRVGFTWDGSARALYVDDVEVASDTLHLGLAPSEGTLYIGAASNLEAGSHWWGLIDDVRVYDRAIQP
ncbi:MAG: hypothetical protein JSU70_11520 [Phycisphaerales bacterium]|nr:MAG: hypothetical protein JSU70_11520 [Phycisphaerales bacterium]